MERAVMFFQKALKQQDSEHAPGLRLALQEASAELYHARMTLDADAEKMSWSPLHRGDRHAHSHGDDEVDPRDAIAESAGWNDFAQNVLERELEKAAIERR